MGSITKYICVTLFLAVFVWGANLAEAGVLLRDCKIKTIAAYKDAIHVQLNFKGEDDDKEMHFQLESPHNPYASAQLDLLRDALIFRKEVDVLVEDVKRKSLILGVALSQKTHL